MRYALHVFIFLIATVAFELKADDFRGYKWGTSRDMIVGKEGKPVEQSDSAVYYQTKVAGISMYVVFKFFNGKLVEGQMVSAEKYMNKKNYSADYDKINELLDKKYGPPSVRRDVWSNDIYKGHIETALSMGHLTRVSTWSTPSLEIQHGVSGEKLKVNHMIFYRDPKSIDRVEKHNEKKALDEL